MFHLLPVSETKPTLATQQLREKTKDPNAVRLIQLIQLGAAAAGGSRGELLPAGPRAGTPAGVQAIPFFCI